MATPMAKRARVADAPGVVPPAKHPKIPNEERGTVSLLSVVKPASSALELPILSCKKKLVELVRSNVVLILVGETGSGKTTQVPQFLLDSQPPLECLSEGKLIGVTQPRRVAATSIAKRVSEERSCELGKEVGYAVRFDDKTSRSTRIKYMTDGILLREILGDPQLDRYGVVILDEAHERTLHGDVLFGLLRNLLDGYSKDATGGYDPAAIKLRVIVMSATLDVDSFNGFWRGAPVCRVLGRQYNVARFHTAEPQPDYQDAAVNTAIQIHLDEKDRPGDILVFLTGQEEIDGAVQIMTEKANQIRLNKTDKTQVLQILPLPLYSLLPPQQQLKVFDPTPAGFRKIIFATNVAETSITISGIRFVVDTGMVKAKHFNASTSLETLRVEPISKAQARQRSGRAGRECAGKCYRLYMQDDFSKLADITVPEIQRANLASVVLHLKHLGIDDVLSFPFMDKPDVASLVKALEQLLALGALDSDGKISDVGKAMAVYPLDPCHAKAMLLSATCGQSVHLKVAIIISMLSIENIFFAPYQKKEEADSKRMLFASEHGDHLMNLKIFEEYVKRCPQGEKALLHWASEHFLNVRSLRRVEETLEQLLTLTAQSSETLQALPRLPSLDDAVVSSDPLQVVRKCFCAAFIHNAARFDVREKAYRCINGNVLVHVHPSSVLFPSQRKPAYVIFNSLVHTSKRFMRDVMDVDEMWVVEFGKLLYKKSETKLKAPGAVPTTPKK